MSTQESIDWRAGFKMISRGRSHRNARVILALALATRVVVGGSSAGAQTPDIKGEAILKHPIGVLALESARLLSAGKIDDVMALSTAAERESWKSASAANRAEMAPLLQKRAPEPRALTQAIRTSGILTITAGTEGELRATMGSANIVAYYKLEGGQWRRESGPIMDTPTVD